MLFLKYKVRSTPGFGIKCKVVTKSFGSLHKCPHFDLLDKEVFVGVQRVIVESLAPLTPTSVQTAINGQTKLTVTWAYVEHVCLAVQDEIVLAWPSAKRWYVRKGDESNWEWTDSLVQSHLRSESKEEWLASAVEFSITQSDLFGDNGSKDTAVGILNDQ